MIKDKNKNTGKIINGNLREPKFNKPSFILLDHNEFY